jgi:signal transduction histidine kinase/ActR/RegA family two-component response regulator
MKLLPPLAQAWRFAPPRLLAAQMALLDRNMPTALAGSMATSWLTAAAFHFTLGDTRVWWWSLMTSLLCIGTWLARRCLPSPADVSRTIAYAQAMRVLWACNGGAWGLMALLFVQPAQPESVNIVLGVVAGMTSAGLAVFGPSWPVAMAYWLCCVVPAALALVLAQGPVNIMLGLATLVYLWVMTVYSYHTARTAQRSIELRFENEGLVARLRDQTQRALEARQLAEEALNDAEEANRAKAVFLASASHDLRQPLHAAGLFLGALGRADLTERQTQLWAQVQASNQAASEMLNTLMDFSKVDAGVVRPQPRSFALQDLFHKLDRELGPWALDKGLAFRMRDTPVVLYADPCLVELMLRNLVLNAIRYTERGAVLLACRRRGPRAVIEVWDTGVGIPAAQHQAIFREFHQLGNPERDRRKGLGLGLAIVDGLARAMGVDIGLASQPGRGSVFRLSLPISTHAVMNEDVVQPQGQLDGLRVLLIDDDESVRVAMSELMAAWGCHCEAVASGEESLLKLDDFAPDVILADYRLRSHRTGLQAVQALWGCMDTPVPAVIITGDTAAERLREAHATGLTLLHKPVPAERLHATLLSLRPAVPPASSARVSATG